MLVPSRREGEPANISTEKRGVLADPNADLVIILSYDESGNYKVASVVRLLSHCKDPLNLLIHSDLRTKVGSLIIQEMQRVGATNFGFLNRNEAKQFLDGQFSSPLGDVLRQQDFSRVPVRDIKINKLL